MSTILDRIVDQARMATSGLGRRLSTIFGALITTIVVAVLLLNLQTQLALVAERQELRLKHLLDLATEVSLPYLIDGRAEELGLLFDDLRRQPDVIGLYIVDMAGQRLVGAGADMAESLGVEAERQLIAEALETGGAVRRVNAEVSNLAKPIRVGPMDLGVLRLDYDKRGFHAEVVKVWTRTALAALLFIVIGLAITRAVASRLVRPLNRLTRATELAAGGDLDQSIQVRTNDELESLANSFNTMLGALRHSIQEIHEVAYVDKLTGVPNRAWLGHQLEQIAIDAATEGHEFAVLFLDLDNFKSVNDNHGHHMGDLLLVQFADRLRRCVADQGLELMTVGSARSVKSFCFDEGAVVARLGGDEFTIVVPERNCRRVAEAILRSMQTVFRLETLSFHTTTSIGVATFPRHAPTYETLLKHADVAMYQAKHAGRNTVAFYDGDQHKLSIERQELEAEIRSAIADDQFVIYLQPQFLVATGEVSGAEALVRWQHPTRGVLGPDLFLPLAAGAGLLPEIGRMVVRKTLTVARRIMTRRDMPLTFAINLSVDELADDSMVEEIVWLIEGSGLPEGSIEIEITENTAMTDLEAIELRLERLHGVGARLAIDDFGVGYSNLGRLKSLAFETLKLDRSLLQDVGEDENAENLMATILAMAQVMQADVVAEGIETNTQLAALSKYNCKYYQGFLGARPMPAERFSHWLDAREAPEMLLPA